MAHTLKVKREEGDEDLTNPAHPEDPYKFPTKKELAKLFALESDLNRRVKAIFPGDEVKEVAVSDLLDDFLADSPAFERGEPLVFGIPHSRQKILRWEAEMPDLPGVMYSVAADILPGKAERRGLFYQQTLAIPLKYFKKTEVPAHQRYGRFMMYKCHFGDESFDGSWSDWILSRYTTLANPKSIRCDLALSGDILRGSLEGRCFATRSYILERLRELAVSKFTGECDLELYWTRFSKKVPKKWTLELSLTSTSVSLLPSCQAFCRLKKFTVRRSHTVKTEAKLNLTRGLVSRLELGGSRGGQGRARRRGRRGGKVGVASSTGQSSLRGEEYTRFLKVHIQQQTTQSALSTAIFSPCWRALPTALRF